MDHAITLRDLLHIAAIGGALYFLIVPVLGFFYLWYAISGGPVWLQRFNSWRSNRGTESPITSINLREK